MLIKLPCISIQQPWAWLIVNGIKDVENRTWHTPPKGWIAIHTGKKFDQESYDSLACRDKACLVSTGFNTTELPEPHEFTTGAIIGVANFHGILKPYSANESPWHAHEQYGWQIKDAYALDKPIPYKGQLGWFTVGIPAQQLKHLPALEKPIGETEKVDNV